MEEQNPGVVDRDAVMQGTATANGPTCVPEFKTKLASLGPSPEVKAA